MGERDLEPTGGNRRRAVRLPGLSRSALVAGSERHQLRIAVMVTSGER